MLRNDETLWIRKSLYRLKQAIATAGLKKIVLLNGGK